GIEPRAVRDRFAWPDAGTRWLVTVARLQRHKGMDTVIAALPAILARAPDVRYAVAGAGPDRERLEKLTHKLGLADRVRFLGGVTDQDLPALYNLASVYVGAARRVNALLVGPRRARPPRDRVSSRRRCLTRPASREDRPVNSKATCVPGVRRRPVPLPAVAWVRIVVQHLAAADARGQDGHDG